MSRGYSTTPLWGLSPNSAVAGIFSWNSRGYHEIQNLDSSLINCGPEKI